MLIISVRYNENNWWKRNAKQTKTEKNKGGGGGGGGAEAIVKE